MPPRRRVARGLLPLLLMCGLALAAGAPADLLQQGFRIQYDVSRNGLGLGVTERELQPQADNQWQFQSRTVAEGMVAVLFRDVVEEASQLRIDGDHAIPVHYRYRRSGGRKNRSYELHFDWQQDRLQFSYTGNSMALAEHTQDALSFFIEVMLRLRAGAERFDMTVAGRKRVRDYEVSTVGSETVETAIGTLPLLHIRAQEVGRDTRYELWCSPAHDFLPLKIKQIKPDETIEFLVRDLQAAT
jgi:hypothetical protein